MTMGRSKELWIKEEERVEEVLVDLLYECVSFYAHEIAYEEFEKLVDQWIKASIQEYILRSWSLVKIGTEKE